MTLQPQTILLTVFGVLMAAAAFEDFRRLTIPNLVPAALCLLWPAYAFATAPSLYDALTAAGCGVAVFLVGAVMFARGWLGGGDVKLLAAVTLWAGPVSRFDPSGGPLSATSENTRSCTMRLRAPSDFTYQLRLVFTMPCGRRNA